MSFEGKGWKIVQSTGLKAKARRQGWHRNKPQGGLGLGSPYLKGKSQWLEGLGEDLDLKGRAPCKLGPKNQEAPTQPRSKRNQEPSQDQIPQRLRLEPGVC